MTWSAPRERMNSSFSALSTPVTSAPCSLASWMAYMPEPPPAPLISTLCPGGPVPCPGWPRLGQSRGFLIGQAGRYRHQRSLRHADVLREPAHRTEDVGEHVLAWPKARHLAARRLHPPGDV